MSDFKSKLITEANELKEKMDELNAFTITDEFFSVDELQKMLLRLQLHSMMAYYKTLELRVELMDNK